MRRIPQLRSRPSRVGLAAAVALSLGALGAACTKVVEPPALPPQAPVVEVEKKRKFAPPPPAWPAAKPAAPTPPPPPPPAAPAVETLNGDPEGLKREDLQNRLDAAMDRFTACVDAPGTTRVALSFDAAPEGGAQNVKVSGGGAVADKCVAGVVAGLSLPKFSGKPVPVHFPIVVQRTVTQQPARPAAEEERRASGGPSGPPMIFVKP